MKFSKYNQPRKNRKKRITRQRHSQEYIDFRTVEALKLKAKNPELSSIIDKTLDISLNP